MRPGGLLVLGLCSQRGRSSEPYRRYMLEAAQAHGDVWLFDIPGQTWQDPLVRGKTDLDVFDAGQSVAAARDLAASFEIRGVWGPDEATITSAAAIAEALSLPGLGEKAAVQARDKSRSRELFREAGLLQPESVAVADLDEAWEVAERIGFPVVLKPRALGASLGVVKAERPADFPDAYHAASSATYPGTPVYERGILVERYIDGPEVSVDGVFRHGRYTPLFVARKRLGFAPFFEEVGHTVDAADPLMDSGELLGALASAHTALGLRDGVSHAEARLTSRGPVLIEINARPGGDFIPRLGLLATGRDVLDAAVLVALGREPALEPARPGAAVIKFLYPPHDARIDSVDMTGAAREDVWARPLVPAGTELRLPPGGYVSRYAYLMASSDSVDACDRAIEEYADTVRITTSPLGGPAAPSTEGEAGE